MEVFSLENFKSGCANLFYKLYLALTTYCTSLESKRAPEEDQQKVRKTGILIAIGLRIVLLFAIIKLLEVLDKPLFGLHLTSFIEGDFTFASIVFVAGGGFLMYTAVKEPPTC